MLVEMERRLRTKCLLVAVVGGGGGAGSDGENATGTSIW